ncbi:MAG TPA: hypothetical protein VFY16_11585 [Gemmatimonadaceae bacterium]|nr:hypothetical protein [Gemmatimonadaceae bacterium]
MDTTFRHTDPLALVEEFVRRDAEGPFEREDIARAWHVGALRCVERNTSDHYEVITAFHVEPLSRRPDTARVLVTRTRVFELGWNATGERPQLAPARAEWTDTVVVVHTRYGWRIDRLHAGAHRLPSRALSELTNLSPADRAQLERLASRVESEPGLTGVYSSLEWNDEGGDLLGMEVFIVGGPDGSVATVQCAGGTPGRPAVVAVTRRGTDIAFTLPHPQPECGLAFTGTVTAHGLRGRFAGESAERWLPRKASYWQ